MNESTMEILTEIRDHAAAMSRRLDDLVARGRASVDVAQVPAPATRRRELVESRPMAFEGFPKDTTAFLRDLTKHNEKAWFEKNRARYEACWLEPAPAFVEAVGTKLQKIAPSIRFEPKVGGSLFRIHRDTRFSKDKSPYKNHFDAWFWEGNEKGWGRPGFFFRLTATELMCGAGMHGMEKEHLAKFRAAVADPKTGPALVALVAKARKAGLEVGREEYKKVPKGYDPDHPRAELLRFGALTAARVTPVPKELTSPKLVDVVVGVMKEVAPIRAWLSDALG